MKATRRAWVDIITDILVNTQDGENITDIMYSTRLSYAHMKEYLNLLIKSGLLAYEEHGDRGVYKTTDRGFQYLETYKRIKHLVFPDEAGKGSSATTAASGSDDLLPSMMPAALIKVKGGRSSSYTSKT
ncbi:winged helix-turn-helix domain-containing protein [Nitrososphaera sp.]|uniref:winged helix-turn-helix domain-containing protein n=1 Tax=Nitrososphaera sp. TaxID=1971748 RepID=UPI00307D24C4